LLKKDSKVIEKFERLTIYPANMFVTSPDVCKLLFGKSARFSETSEIILKK
jgi:hypothetical protein